ncbi:mitochondrial pyruvate carrier 2-like [Paramacrobiotus metropolitanus]|uniref:mitochondrial pyruvate carrier 2-like n=1 Tax=Paramacrobiotus metropolitanus TaxID=2943436 RepID=UPI002445E687|nr:mitochondrial pyruvate carrier 2-like [Paramacrobiotus metropolitanus]
MSIVYRSLVNSAERFVPARLRPIWEHPAGPKTIHFWAPLGKWALVVAGLADAARPAEKLSLNQSLALTATGLIWSRYSLVIIPKNWSLFAVNMFVAATGISQLYRIWEYRSTAPTGPVIEPVAVAVVEDAHHLPGIKPGHGKH